jgi:hypothetical protein
MFLLLAVVIAPLKASAWTGFYFNGAWKTVSNNGAAITIETQNPTISEDSSVSAWAMTCNGTDSYAQVGWVKFSGYTAPKYFYEYNYEPDGVWYQKTLGTATAGSHNDFMVGCDSTTMYFKINGILMERFLSPLFLLLGAWSNFLEKLMTKTINARLSGNPVTWECKV